MQHKKREKNTTMTNIPEQNPATYHHKTPRQTTTLKGGHQHIPQTFDAAGPISPSKLRRAIGPRHCSRDEQEEGGPASAGRHLSR
jgi:hypothetical protein